jgi:hypothetical protein|tara:strand:- start:228 stop:929 length:702 start_codon:yes stop_codon:yes gene_type:complete
MALPKLNTQTFSLEIPSTDEKIRFRPFLVKEEKILLQAQEGGEDEMVDALKDIVSNCTFNKVDIDKLPSFDVEYIFMKIRAKSVGEKVKIQVTCPDDKVTKVPVTIDLDKIEVEVTDKHTNKISLTDEVNCIMKYPTLKNFLGKSMSKATAVDAVSLVSDCIHQIIDGKEVFESNDLSKKELDEFVDNLTQAQFAKMNDFFSTMPKLKHIVNVTNPKTKKKGKVTLEGMQSFF